MPVTARTLSILALAAALAACTSTAGEKPAKPAVAASAAPAVANAMSGKSTLDAAIDAAGGQPALAKVKELYWTASGTKVIDAKPAEIDLEVVLRPFSFIRATTTAKGAAANTGKSIQIQPPNGWAVSRVGWTPLSDGELASETQQYGLYGLMQLTNLKDASAKVTDTGTKDGLKTIHVERPGAAPTDLSFDAAGKLVKAAYSVANPKGGAAIAETAEFSGEVVSNGVKWPKKISVKQNGAAYLDLEISKFEARPEPVVTPIKHTL